MAEKDESRAATIVDRKKGSRAWMQSYFYDEWVEAFSNYKLIADERLELDGTEDPDLARVGSPLTNATVRRLVARSTAQAPHLSYHAKDKEVSELIGRKLMYDWDRARIQRIQKRHLLQAALFGWSPRAWYWDYNEYLSTKRIDITKALMSPGQLELVALTYSINPRYLQPGTPITQKILTNLLAKHGRGKLLPIKYLYKHYEGSNCEFTFVGDCFPEPYFQSIQTSNWFIINRRRDRQWFDDLAEAYPDLKAGIQRIMDSYKNGMPRRYDGHEEDDKLFTDMMAVLDKESPGEYISHTQQSSVNEWTVTEHHTREDGETKLEYVVGDVYLGRIDYPYDLAGKFAFTECVLIDDIMTGIGDSQARLLRGLHKMHEKQQNTRYDLVYNISRPLLGTSNRRLIENQEEIKRGNGFRMVYMRGPGDLWTQPEQAAMAAASVSLNDETSIMRMHQLLTGENNMSLAAGVDPKQGETATGAKLLAAQQDILTKDINDMFLQTSLIEDAEMMRLLNRSELNDAVEFEASRYNRAWSYSEDAYKERWIKVEPLHFQVEGEVVVEAGSTLADDDGDRQAIAEKLFNAALSAPGIMNISKARDEFLITHGKRHELEQWQPEPPPPPPEPETKKSVSISLRGDDLTPDEKTAVFQEVFPPPPPEQMPPQGGMLPPGAAPSAGGPPL